MNEKEIKKFKVTINAPNTIFIIKGKAVRSPFESIISEHELSQVRAKINAEGIKDYFIEEFDSEKKYDLRLLDEIEKLDIAKKHSAIKPRKKKEPTTTLEKFTVE